MDADKIELDVLSAQHRMDGFDSGHAESNALAIGLLRRVKERDVGDFVAIVAADRDTHEVAGIAATTDLVMVAPDVNGEELSGTWLFYYLIAVSRAQAARGVLPKLLEEFETIRERQFARRAEYVGELAAPLRGSAAEENSIQRYLEQRGFRRLDAVDPFWVRPR